MLEGEMNALRNQLETAGISRPNILTKLGQQHNFIEAITSSIGKELLKDLATIAEDRLDKIIKEDATPQDKADFRVCKSLLIKYGNKINAYEKNLAKLRGEVNARSRKPANHR